MSRGFGKVQTVLVGIIRHHKRPMTWAEMRGGLLSASLERSARRALHGLVENQMLITLSNGGPSDPYRYFLHPFFIGFLPDEQEARILLAALDPYIPRSHRSQSSQSQ
jgi:hypothetical protein